MTQISLVGDALARPMNEAFDAAADAGRPYDLSSLQRIVSTGATLSTDQKRAFQRHAPQATILDMVGASEGRPFAVAMTMPGDERKTAETFRVIDGVRYTVPGDFATIAEDGTVTLLGRGSVCINSGGEKVYPEEVEVAARSHPAVVDATAVGVPDERFGKRIVVVWTARGRLPNWELTSSSCCWRFALLPAASTRGGDVSSGAVLW